MFIIRLHIGNIIGSLLDHQNYHRIGKRSPIQNLDSSREQQGRPAAPA
jgi:hypothetical protein